MISWKYWHEFELINTFSFTIFSKYHVHKDNQSCQNILLILKINRMPYCSLFHVGQRHRVMRDRKNRFWKKHALSTIESLLMTHRLWRNIFEVFRQSLPICLSTIYLSMMKVNRNVQSEVTCRQTLWYWKSCIR